MFGHFLLMSLIAIGGAISVTPEMHRYLVDTRGWITDAQFAQSITLAQVVPGPNILFVALFGWHIGGVFGAMIAMAGILLPASLIAFATRRLIEARRDAPWVAAMRAGTAPIAIACTAAAGLLIARANDQSLAAVAVTGVTVVVCTFSRFNPLWLIGAAAVLGFSGLI